MRKGKSGKYYESRAYKSAMVDVKSMLERPNRLQPTEDARVMNQRSRALANLLGLTHGIQ